MRNLILFSFFVFLFFGCEKQATDISNISNQISFNTDKYLYTNLDTIFFQIDNKTDTTFTIAMICNQHLEMFYQKKENGHWSDNLFFSYMFLKCPTFIDSIESGNRFNSSMTLELFESTGIFRLILDDSVFSNSFEIN